MGKHRDKLEEMYQEIDSKYSKLSENEIKELIAVPSLSIRHHSQKCTKKGCRCLICDFKCKVIFTSDHSNGLMLRLYRF